MNSEGRVLRCRFLSTPKQGNSPGQIEDAGAWNCDLGRFALADGASESMLAGEWAKVLTDAYVVDGPDEKGFAHWLRSTQARWTKEISSRSVPWYVEEKMRDGAFATFLGLTVSGSHRDAARPWTALAVGDCCLFQVVEQRVKLSFPLQTSAEFGTRPTLVRSHIGALVEPAVVKGTLRPRDLILIMSDALAQWFLKQNEMGRTPWRELADLPENRFLNWTENLRRTRQMHNDDVSLLMIEFDDFATE